MAAEWRTPSYAGIRALLIERIDVEHEGVGIVVGLIDQRGRRVVSHGALAKGDRRPLNGDTVFEIGSITKVFTGLLLADMVERGEVGLDDPAAAYLPPEVTLPEHGGRPITLIDLATHTAGLPRWPTDIGPLDWSNPYAAYTVDQLHAFLGAYRPPSEAGGAHLYSNLGMGLLGHVLALKAGVDYASLVRARITGPLRMADTGIALSPDQLARLAVGHDAELKATSNWDMRTFAGAGALRSTANDLLTLMGAELGYPETPLKVAMTAQIQPRRPTDADYIQTLGWRIDPGPASEIVWHGGATGGYRCFVLFDPARRAGVVMLTNAASMRNDDIPFHLLAGRPLAPRRETVPVASEVLDRYVGRYRLSARAELSVTRDGEQLFIQLTGQPAFAVLAESPTAFVWKTAAAKATFRLDPDGSVIGLVLSQNGRDLPAARAD